MNKFRKWDRTTSGCIVSHMHWVGGGAGVESGLEPTLELQSELRISCRLGDMWTVAVRGNGALYRFVIKEGLLKHQSADIDLWVCICGRGQLFYAGRPKMTRFFSLCVPPLFVVSNISVSSQ
ncbi:unnamed protein product [Protopolystoma xenopodis]|uniref:Uncharacterized protein n=1 Tax=Protopolystoma xenopodis TaxID=117903 RepID=A0A448WQU6_9PLAT|nr:unnamed protein product [Protopolystoma xenopodis]